MSQRSWLRYQDLLARLPDDRDWHWLHDADPEAIPLILTNFRSTRFAPGGCFDVWSNGTSIYARRLVPARKVPKHVPPPKPKPKPKPYVPVPPLPVAATGSFRANDVLMTPQRGRPPVDWHARLKLTREHPGEWVHYPELSQPAIQHINYGTVAGIVKGEYEAKRNRGRPLVRYLGEQPASIEERWNGYDPDTRPDYNKEVTK